MFLALMLLLVAGGLLGYGVITQFTKTDPTQSTLKRVWASVVLGAGALGAALLQWVHGMTGP